MQKQYQLYFLIWNIIEYYLLFKVGDFSAGTGTAYLPFFGRMVVEGDWIPRVFVFDLFICSCG